MIKEKKKSKYNIKKTTKQIVFEYLRTVGYSILLAIVITSSLAIHARHEMIKNIYAEDEIQQKLDKEVALKLIAQTDLLKDLKNKKYAVCLHVGELYEAAGDYKNAQIAYELAVEKAKPNTYTSFYKLICVLAEQEKFDKANSLLKGIKDFNSKKLVKFKTRSYLTLGDKYYSIGKFISAGKNYEKADFYYNKFAKKDAKIDDAIKRRIVNAYIQAADLMVKSGLNSDAIRYLKRAEKYSPKNFEIRYKLAIILADSDPEKSVEYFEPLLDEIPQEIDYAVYGRALMKAANIADLDNRPTQAKYYRYRIHSIDMFINRKVVYKNDIEVNLISFPIKKIFFTYPLRPSFSFINVSAMDIINLYADFELISNKKTLETVTVPISNRNKPLFSGALEPNLVTVNFKRNIFTKKELENYTIKIYIYKDKKFKTFIAEMSIPIKTINSNIDIK